jgi:hypothetical protein
MFISADPVLRHYHGRVPRGMKGVQPVQDAIANAVLNSAGRITLWIVLGLLLGLTLYSIYRLLRPDSRGIRRFLKDVRRRRRRHR